MIDLKELQKLAEVAKSGLEGLAGWSRFHAAANPATVIALLDERNAMLEALGPGGRYWFVERAKLIEVLKAARVRPWTAEAVQPLFDAVAACAEIKTDE